MQIVSDKTSNNLSHKLLLDKIINKQAVIAVVGLGYVGLPLLFTAHQSGFHLIGFDVDNYKIDRLQAGQSYLKSFTDAQISELISSDRFSCSYDAAVLATADVVIICVPTPLTEHREPDMSYVLTTSAVIAKHLQPNQLVVLESTTYPGTTAEVVQPILEQTGCKLGEDLFLAYSPEREDPGNPVYSTSKIPKVVGADDPVSLELAIAVYEQLVPKVVAVSSAATAEAVKLTENIFRCTNIALVNELKILYTKMGIDIWEVIEAAKTKPFGFMPFYPGPGLGGHCIPIDPFYLTWKAREYGLATRFIELAGEINTGMPAYVIARLRDALDQQYKKPLNGSKILLLGVAYKKNVDDIRESPALEIWDQLLQKQVQVDYYDLFIPTIPGLRKYSHLSGIKSMHWDKIQNLDHDAVIICTDHDEVDYDLLVTWSKLVIDTRRAIKSAYANVVLA